LPRFIRKKRDFPQLFPENRALSRVCSEILLNPRFSLEKESVARLAQENARKNGSAEHGKREIFPVSQEQRGRERKKEKDGKIGGHAHRTGSRTLPEKRR
jgi:hypothetical protein